MTHNTELNERFLYCREVFLLLIRESLTDIYTNTLCSFIIYTDTNTNTHTHTLKTPTLCSNLILCGEHACRWMGNC